MAREPCNDAKFTTTTDATWDQIISARSTSRFCSTRFARTPAWSFMVAPTCAASLGNSTTHLSSQKILPVFALLIGLTLTIPSCPMRMPRAVLDEFLLPLQNLKQIVTLPQGHGLEGARKAGRGPPNLDGPFWGSDRTRGVAS